LGLSHPGNMTDPKLIDRVLQNATRLTGITGNVKFGDRTLVLVQAEDLGMVDYYKLSFRLFGFTIEGFYYTYWLLLAVSAALFIICFWRSPAFLLTLNVLLMAHFLAITYVVLGFPDAPPLLIGNVHDGRFLSVLGIIPALHLMLLFLGERSSNPRITCSGTAYSTGSLMMATGRAVSPTPTTIRPETTCPFVRRNCTWPRWASRRATWSAMTSFGTRPMNAQLK